MAEGALQVALLREREVEVEAEVALTVVVDRLPEAQRYRVSLNLHAFMANQLQIVVEKLTKNVNEDHLKEIFAHYGTVQDIDMPINRQCKLSFQFIRELQLTPVYSQHKSRHSLHSLLQSF
jgi:hypothetical protein